MIWVSPSRAESPFSEAFGTFTDAPLSIDGDRATSATTSGIPYRGEYFLVVKFTTPSIIRNLKVHFEGPAPRTYTMEIAPDARTWRPYDLGEKATYVKIRFPAKEGESYKISEIESNSSAAPREAFLPSLFAVSRAETTTASIVVSFPKPFRMSVAYGLAPRPDALTNFTEYTSYLSDYQISLRDLKEGLDYYVSVKAVSAEGDVWTTEDTALLHFRLKGTPPLSILNSGVGHVSPLSISLVIQTNIPSHCVFYFGEMMRFDRIVSQPDFETHHVFKFDNLLPSHVYSYMAHLTDHRGMTLTQPKTQITTSEINIARGKRVIDGTFTDLRDPEWQGGVIGGETVLQRVTDGRNDYFSGMAHSGNLVTADQYATVDLGRVYTLQGHVTAWRQLAFPYSYEVMISEDNKKWSKAFTLPEGRVSEAPHVRSLGGDPLILLGGEFPDETKARYVKLFIPKRTNFYKKHKKWNNVDLAEFVIYPGGDYAEIKRIVDEEWRP
ncbi:discoidin domain-containing protein [bacterium]|nr:discoidin domain-containing protein [bacterium]